MNKMKHFQIKKHKLIFLLFLLESISLYLFAPAVYSYYFNLFCCFQYISTSFYYIYIQKKINFFDFDIIFLMTYFFVMFFFPVFMYETDLENLFSLFKYSYNHNVISRATALSLVGSSAYMFGSSLVKAVPYRRVEYNIPTSILAVFTFIVFVLMILSAGGDLFEHTYNGVIGGESASSITTYLVVLLTSLILAGLTVELVNWKSENKTKINSIILLNALLFTIVFLMIGSRTIPIQIVLMFMGLYSLLIRPIKLKLMLLLICTGILGLGVIGLTRVGGASTLLANFDRGGLIMFLQDLVVNNRSTFIAIDYVEKNGITYGTSMLTTLLSIFPFMNSIFISTTGMNYVDMASSFIITTTSVGRKTDLDLGFGTNIIADIYIAFGFIGVILFMIALGYIVKKSLIKSFYENNIYYIILYGVLMSYAVYIVRAEYFVFLRYFIWGGVIVNIFIHHPYKLIWKFKQVK